MNNTENHPSNNARPAGRPRLWLHIVLLITVFICGGISGVFLATQKARSHIRTMLHNPEQAKDLIIQELTSKLSLNKNQASQIEEIVHRRHAAIVAIRREASPLILNEFDGLESELFEILDSDQQARFREITKIVRDVFLPTRR